MAETDKPNEIFDLNRRISVRKRANSRCKGQDFFGNFLADDIIERLSLVTRSFSNCLIIGLLPENLKIFLDTNGIAITTTGPEPIGMNSTNFVKCREDHLPFADHSFDLIISIGVLDIINDLPGALILIRRILIPDGMFLAAFPGAESLPLLKAALIKAEENRIVAHIHPQIDVRTAGDLLTRAGFALPVSDSHRLQLRYGALSDLVSDLRNYGGGNVMAGSTGNISKQTYQRAISAFSENAEPDGKVTEIVEVIYLCGWSPHPDQPLPAKRGSGQVSLTKALGGKNELD